MYRPWWFPEYSPREQVIFDTFADILRKHFTQRNYVHIQTPAVEPVDILSRGGDVFDKQVYGLYGLAQWVEDVKDYALHFDLTIPFARYTLDHLNELTFPFKRYQMQPVWRGERQKRGRYKEFRQFDIDTIWKADQEGGVRYDAESVMVMTKALQEVFQSMKVEGTIIVKLSNIRLIKSLLSSRNTTPDTTKQVFKILDDRYKRSWEENIILLKDCLSSEQANFIQTVVTTGDLSLLQDYDGYADTVKIGEYLTAFGMKREFALPIVRGHGYYTGMVAELFIAQDMSLGAIAGWGRYEKLTDFIDPKHSFSGVWLSVSNRVMEIILQADKTEKVYTDSYFFIYFEDTLPQILSLMKQYVDKGSQIEFAPAGMKLGKQIELADKKWCRYIILLGSGEYKEGCYTIKNLQTGESKVEKL